MANIKHRSRLVRVAVWTLFVNILFVPGLYGVSGAFSAPGDLNHDGSNSTMVAAAAFRRADIPGKLPPPGDEGDGRLYENYLAKGTKKGTKKGIKKGTKKGTKGPGGPGGSRDPGDPAPIMVNRTNYNAH